MDTMETNETTTYTWYKRSKVYERIIRNPTQGQYNMFRDFVKEHNPRDVLDVDEFLAVLEDILAELEQKHHLEMFDLMLRRINLDAVHELYSARIAKQVEANKFLLSPHTAVPRAQALRDHEPNSEAKNCLENYLENCLEIEF